MHSEQQSTPTTSRIPYGPLRSLPPLYSRLSTIKAEKGDFRASPQGITRFSCKNTGKTYILSRPAATIGQPISLTGAAPLKRSKTLSFMHRKTIKKVNKNV